MKIGRLLAHFRATLYWRRARAFSWHNAHEKALRNPWWHPHWYSRAYGGRTGARARRAQRRADRLGHP